MASILLANPTEDLLACRVCLATSPQLHSIHGRRLADIYFDLTGAQVSVWDGMPQHICSCCSTLLHKFAAFKERALRTLQLLQEAQLHEQLITTAYIRTINRIANHLKLTLNRTHTKTIEYRPEQDDVTVKTDDNNQINRQMDINVEISVCPEIDFVKKEDIVCDKNVMDKRTHVKTGNKRKRSQTDTDRNKKTTDNYQLDNSLDKIKDEFEINLEDLNNCNDLITVVKKINEEEISNTEFNFEVNDSFDTEDDELISDIKKRSVSNTNNNKKIKKSKNTKSVVKEEKPKKMVTKRSNIKNIAENVSNEESRSFSKRFRNRDNEISKFENTYGVDVITLSKQEQIEEVLLRKNTDEYLKSDYNCDKCFKVCQSEFALKNHMARHEALATGGVECDVCHLQFRNKKRLQRHVVGTHELRIVCRTCKHVTRSRAHAKEHYQSHAGFKYQCKYCQESFKARSTYFAHVRLKHPAEHKSCDVCGEKFIGDMGVWYHKNWAHRELVKPEHKCSTCGSQFHNVEALTLHVATSCDLSVKPCLECGRSFSTEEALRIHQEQQHIREKQLYKCEICDKAYPTQRKYESHRQRLHLDVELRRRGRGKLAPPNRYVCEICGKELKSAGAMIYHRRRHTGERPYHCPLCPKRFAVRILLQNHLQTHSAERRFACPLPQCARAFKHYNNMKRHVKEHEGVRPYKCSVCERAFFQSSSLRVHYQTVHLKMPAPPRRRRRRNPHQKPPDMF